MAIRIIVDGYNFIGREKGLQGNIEARREELIDRLARYQGLKGHPVTVVFDGWRSGWPDEHGELRRGIEVVFSRHGERADQVIARMADELGSACLVVSSDREVARHVQAAGGVAVSAGEFETRLSRAVSGHPDKEIVLEDDTAAPGTEKKGNPRRLSKQERKRRLRLNKL
ncbi:MAG TPA: NYN domain-containing protein [Nitrospiria bacterium]|jgi:predicted RNA-binding protein with PIN domain|nr:NYN domain-containing protein [Nitrospiria bacterium]